MYLLVCVLEFGNLYLHVCIYTYVRTVHTYICAYLIFILILLLTIQSDYRQDGQAELICCSIEGEGMHS